MNSKLIFVCLATLVIVEGAAGAGTGIIRIGAFNDLSGASSDIGRDYALGIAEAVHYINDQGGIGGKWIRLYQYDYGYRQTEVHAKYKHFKRLGVAAIFGWHIVDTAALAQQIVKDKIPFLTASYSPGLTNPKQAPFSLFAATDVSSNARAALTAWFDEKWPENKAYGTRRPRVQFVYMFASANLSAPIKALKDQAELFGFDIGSDLDISIFAVAAGNQVQAMKNFKPDVVWHGNTALSVAATIRGAVAEGLNTDHLVNSWAFDKDLIRLAGEAAEGIMGATTCGFYGEDVPMMDKVLEYSEKINPGVPSARRLNRTVQAWANALALQEALTRADQAGELSAENIMKKGFETFKAFNVGLRVPSLTYTATDHRAAGKVNIYQIEKGKFVFMTAIDLKGRWPFRWAEEWFGW